MSERRIVVCPILTPVFVPDRLPSCPSDETSMGPEHIKMYRRADTLCDGRFEMSMSIGCKDLGMDCRFMTEGETGEVVIESLMRHVETEHAEDWFEIEEIHQVAWKVVRAKAA
jgi:predicted small metal-binding protein